MDPLCKAKAGTNPYSLKADRGKGRLLLCYKKRIVELFHIAVSSEMDAPLDVVYNNPIAGLPSWLPMESLADIANTINGE